MYLSMSSEVKNVCSAMLKRQKCLQRKYSLEGILKLWVSTASQHIVKEESSVAERWLVECGESLHVRCPYDWLLFISSSPSFVAGFHTTRVSIG